MIRAAKTRVHESFFSSGVVMRDAKIGFELAMFQMVERRKVTQLEHERILLLCHAFRQTNLTADEVSDIFPKLSDTS